MAAGFRGCWIKQLRSPDERLRHPGITPAASDPGFREELNPGYDQHEIVMAGPIPATHVLLSARRRGSLDDQ
jgi:hypothetical protein